MNVARDCAAERRERVDREAYEHNGTATQRVRQRTVPQHHEGVGKEIGRQRLLNSDLRDSEFQRNGVERRDVHVDRKRTEHRQRRKQRGERP